MSKSLEQAAAENAAWEAKKKAIDARMADRLTKPDAPVVPAPKFPAPLRDRVDNFGYNFRQTFESYLAEMRVDADRVHGAAKGELQTRIGALQEMLQRFGSRHEDFFKQKSDEVLGKYLKQAITPGNVFHSEANAVMLAEARDKLTELKTQYVIEQGMGTSVLRAPPQMTVPDFFAKHGVTFDGYIDELRKLSRSQGAPLKDRADSMERMLQDLKKNVDGFFHNKRDVALKRFMTEAYTIDAAYFSTQHGNGMNMAVKDFTKLQALHADQGVMMLP